MTMRPRAETFRAAVAAGVLVALARCGGCDSVPEGAVTKCQVTTIVGQPAKTDILFVIDDSGSMRAEQENLAASFHAFVDRLASSPVKNEFQIGVTTTSVDWPTYDSGGSGSVTVHTTYGDGRPYAAGALVAAEGKPKLLPASSPTLVDDFDANVNVGISGAAKEQGLRAARLAVTDRIADGSNAGLLRSGARLALIIVSDEDDCSDPASPPAVIYPASGDACHSDADQAKLPAVPEYVAALRAQLAGEVRDVVVAVIGSVDPQTKQPVQPACNPFGYPAKRYKAFVDAFETNGYVDDVCLADFAGTLRAIAGLLDPGQTVELSETPADPRLLAVQLARADGTTAACTVAQAGEAGAGGADAIYRPPQQGRPAALTFQNACELRQGDTLRVEVLCAG